MKAVAGSAVLALLLLVMLQDPAAAAAPAKFDVNVFVTDSCIVADEPFFLPADRAAQGSSPQGAKFIPLLGVVVGKLAELYISHELQGAASAMKAKAERKDTRYALTRQMNLYRADLMTAPTLNINARLGCMTVVAARLKPAGSDCRKDYQPRTLAEGSELLPQEKWQTSRQDDSVENQLRRANICVDGQARAVYEARFEFSADGTAYRLHNAGYQINTLLTTDDRSAQRTALCTLRLTQPGRTDDKDVLTSAWVNLGTVSANAHSSGSAEENPPWLHVPALSEDARRDYDEKTRSHQQVHGEIEALTRALTRNRRMLAGIDQRIAGASREVAAGLRSERVKVAVQIETQSAELEARTAEYQELPRSPLEFMPVTVEVAITETESEKKSQLALAELLGDNSSMLASTIGGEATSLLSKSLNAAELKTDPDSQSPAEALESARTRYFDAWVVARTGSPGDAGAAGDLRAARDLYNGARRRMGLPPVQ